MTPNLIDAARDVVTDYGCEDCPDDCDCSVSVLARAVADLDRVREEWTPDPSTIRVITEGVSSSLAGDGPCADCGSEENIVWFTDDILWNQAVRTDPAREGRDAILCIRCFVAAVEDWGFAPTRWRLIPEYPVRRIGDA